MDLSQPRPAKAEELRAAEDPNEDLERAREALVDQGLPAADDGDSNGFSQPPPAKAAKLSAVEDPNADLERALEALTDEGVC